MERIIYGKYFYGNEVSEYGRENHRVDYSTLAKSFNAVLNNNIYEHNYFKLVNGNDFDEENECYEDIFQYYIIDENGAEILKNWTDEIVYYNTELDMYLWGVTHWGTSWKYVLTDIEIYDTRIEDDDE